MSSPSISRKITHKTPEFKHALDGRKVQAKVIRIYDGDTCFVTFNPWPLDPNSQEWEFRVRLMEYNSEEIRQKKDDPDREEKKQKALEDKQALASLIEDKIVTLECSHFDNFGRILAHVYTPDGVCVNKKMLEDNHGVPFMQTDDF